MGAEEVAIVAGSSFWGAECGVRFADLDEALGCGGVVWVEVGVVGFGELVELSGTDMLVDGQLKVCCENVEYFLISAGEALGSISRVS